MQCLHKICTVVTLSSVHFGPCSSQISVGGLVQLLNKMNPTSSAITHLWDYPPIMCHEYMSPHVESLCINHSGIWRQITRRNNRKLSNGRSVLQIYSVPCAVQVIFGLQLHCVSPGSSLAYGSAALVPHLLCALEANARVDQILTLCIGVTSSHVFTTWNQLEATEISQGNNFSSDF